MIKGFFAYPDKPEVVSDTISRAINSINGGGVYELLDWKTCKIGGRVIIGEILREIDSRPLFCADLSTLNANVLFELGYAIARKKRIWTVIDLTNTSTKRAYEELGILSQVGSRRYQNSHEIEHFFYEDELEHSLDYVLSDELDLKPGQSKAPIDLLYLKTSVNTDASSQLTELIEKENLEVIIDDPRETQTPTLGWYIRHLLSTSGVIAHFVDDTREGATIHNAKCAFISGMAIGLAKRTLMLVAEPYAVPFDYQDYIFKYKTADESTTKAIQFLLDIIVNRQEFQQNTLSDKETLRALTHLQSLSFGEEQAENESEALGDYFVETFAYLQALREHVMLFVGRKGTGKTANLLQVSKTLRENRRNFVCEVRPVEYEIDGIIELLSKLSNAERGFLLESLWKFLLYTELAYKFRDELSRRPVHIVPSEHESELMEFCERHNSVFNQSFTLRLESAISLLKTETNKSSFLEQNLRFSEFIHKAFLTQLRTILGKVLAGRDKIVFLVDNLDKGWSKNTDLRLLSHFLFGLINAQRPLVNEFQKDHHKDGVKVSLLVFLRTDIYNHIVSQAAEPDKVPIEGIRWDDPQLLLKILEERYKSSNSSHFARTEDLWKKVFTPEVKGIKTSTYITDVIVPRPRDIVFFANAALQEAVNHRNPKIEENDVIGAEKAYSRHVFNSILAEDISSPFKVEDVLYELAGQSSLIDQELLFRCFERAGVNEDKYSLLTQHLINLTVLGVEVREDEFRYLYDESERKKIEVLARNLSERKDGQRRFRIHRALWDFLFIQHPPTEIRTPSVKASITH